MSDLYGGKYTSSLYKRKEPSSLYGGLQKPGKISQGDLELLPYLQQERAQQAEEKSWLTPLELVFDLLSRPQYLTANIGQDIAEGKSLDKILTGAWKGLTGERKGDWKTTLFGGKDVGEKAEGKGIFPGATWAKNKIPILGDIPIVKNLAGTWEDAIGLLANIVLDPTTYMTFGMKAGATAANKASARFAAKEAVKKSIFDAGNIDDLAKMAKKGFDKNAFKELAERSIPGAEKYLKRFIAPKDMAKFNERLFNKSFKEMLGMTGKEFTEKMVKGTAEGSAELLERATDEFAKQGMKGLKFNIGEIAKINPNNKLAQNYYNFIKLADDLPPSKIKSIYEDLLEAGAEGSLNVEKIFGPSFDRFLDFKKSMDWYRSADFAANVAHLGERKVADFFGKEIGKGVRRPNFLAQTSEKIKSAIGRSPIGSFGKAVAAKLDGPVGWLKKTLNIKNPYEQMLGQMKMDNHYYADMLIHDGIAGVDSIYGKIDDKTLETVRDILDYGKAKNIADPVKLLTDPQVSKMLSGADAKKVGKLLQQHRDLVQQWFLEESELAGKGLLVSFEPIANYLHHRSQVASKKIPTRELGPFRPGFTKHQVTDLTTIARQDQSVIKHFLGVDDATAKKIADMGWSTTNMDLKEMMMYRAHAHARAVATANMAEMFAQFGVKLDPTTMTPDVAASLSRAGEAAFAGMREIQTEIPALKGMLFDEDVANILDRIIPVVESDKGMGKLRKAMSYLTSMFKGYATLSPGFHLRNDRSNMVTGFINYGAGFLNPKRKLDGILLSAYGLYGEEGMKKLVGKIGMKDYAINKLLNKTVGGKTYRQWAQVMREKGIISKASMGYNLEEAIEKLGTKDPLLKRLNPLATDNVYFKGSREVGAVIESSARAQGFLIDIEKMAGKGGGAASGMIDEAVRNVKKYFFDYEDLSKVEQQYLKKIIPFYSWIRKNIALQIDQLIRKPGTMGAVAKTVKAMTDEEAEDVPEWARMQGGIPVDQSAEGIAQVLFPDLPFKDINQIPVMFDMEGPIPVPKPQPQAAWDNFLSMAHPVFKTVTTLTGEGWDPFRRQQLDSKSPAPRAFRLLGKNPEVFAFIDSVFKAVGIKDGLGLEVDEKTNKIQMDGQAAKLLEDNFLLLRRLDDMGDVVTNIFPQIEEELERLTGITSKYEDKQKVMRTLSTMLGFSQKDFDRDKQAEYEFRDALRRAEAERAKDRRKTPGSQRRSSRYYQSYQKRIRRLRSATE
jgi:hypothetical protein